MTRLAPPLLLCVTVACAIDIPDSPFDAGATSKSDAPATGGDAATSGPATSAAPDSAGDSGGSQSGNPAEPPSQTTGADASSSSGGFLVGTSGSTFAWGSSSSGSFGLANCGNGIIDDLAEFCDGEDFGGDTCLDYGFEAGDLSCGPLCFPNLDDCIP